jgi:hypothetical protein
MTNPLHYVAVRIIIYALSLLPLAALEAMAGWGVMIQDGVIVIEVEALVRAILGALVLSGGVYRIWGKR